jgi:arylsulfatase A-like enzyme
MPFSCGKQSRKKAKAKTGYPNVLLISIDTLRPDHLTCYGYRRSTSPVIDELASAGVLFENHISSTSWTLPAHAALFTSLPDSVHGCTDTDRKLHKSFKTAAEVFADAGYETAGFFSGPYLHPAFGLGQGFDHYENCTSYAKSIDSTPAKKWAMDTRVMRQSHRDVTNPIVYAAFKQWLAKKKKSPFFMFVHLWDAHFDFIPPPPYDKKFDADYNGTVNGENFFLDPRINAQMPERDLRHIIALYDGEIAWTDYHVGKMVTDLKKAGLLEKTIIVITSDHGTEFFEHGDKAHRKTLFDEVIRIPLIIRYPAGLPAGVRVQSQTRLIDVAPTLFELAGLPAADQAMGSSLVRLAAGKKPGFDNTAISELFSVGRSMRTIRTAAWKFTDHINLNRRYFFDLTHDPGEKRLRINLAKDPGLRLLTQYRAISKELIIRRSRSSKYTDRSTIPEDVLKQLKSLGYIDK